MTWLITRDSCELEQCKHWRLFWECSEETQTLQWMVPHWVSSSTGGEPEAGQASKAVGPQSGKYTVGSEYLLPSASLPTGKVKGTAVQHQHQHRLGRCCTLQNEGSGQKDGHSFPQEIK